jgi:DedD protein
MPDAIEPQLDELRRRARRRLVGAVVLALAAAVLVPMLLESDPKPLGEDVSVKIPPVDEGRFVSKLGEKSRAADGSSTTTAKPVPAPAPKSADAATAAAAKETSRESASPPTPTKPSTAEATPAPQAVKPPVKEAPATPSKDSSSAPSPSQTTAPPPKPASDAPASTSSEVAKAAKSSASAFSVQLAAFADDKGANALANRLKKAGHPAYTEPYTTSQGTLWRVRVGPYATREAAETARTKLKADGQNGIIAATN